MVSSAVTMLSTNQFGVCQNCFTLHLSTVTVQTLTKEVKSRGEVPVAALDIKAVFCGCMEPDEVDQWAKG